MKLKIIAGIACVLALASCTAPDRAEKALLDAGYTDISLGGYDPWSCSEDDTFATKFTAVGPTGRSVKGTVCNGYFKGVTIRLN